MTAVKANRKLFDLDMPGQGRPVTGMHCEKRQEPRSGRGRGEPHRRARRTPASNIADRLCLLLLALGTCYILIHLAVAVKKGVF